MEFVKAMKITKRICEDDGGNCGNCPLYSQNNKKGVLCGDFLKNYPEEAEEILTKWAEEHPQKTILTDFLEKYPNALLNESGFPNVCVFKLGYIKERDCGNYDYSCKKCWNRPLED